MPIDGLDLRTFLDLYDANRFIDLYRRTRPAWEDPGAVDRLTAEELVHAGRLAGRLGGLKLARWLLRLAHAREPEHPLVRYFARAIARGGDHQLAELQEREDRPDLGSGDPYWEASWCAYGARLLACVRDFTRAHRWMERATSFGADRAWVHACEGEVLFCEGRWDEALAAAEAAWEMSPGMPAAALILGKALVRLGRLPEAVDRLLAVAEAGQSHETLRVALWYALALAGRSGEPERSRWARRAYDLGARVLELAPLADRFTRSAVAHLRVDAAVLLGDRDRMRRHAAEADSPFFRTICEAIERNPDGARILAPYRPVFQKHATCLPASMCAVLGGFGLDVDPDALAEEMTYGGTAEWRAIDWLAGRGFATRAFVATPELCRSLLVEGISFVYCMQWVGAAHATAAIGIDDASGTLILHDPANDRWDLVILDRMGEDEAPFGPLAIAFAPPDRAAVLERIPAEARIAVESLILYRKRFEMQGLPAAGEVVESLSQEHPDHPATRRLRAVHDALSGRVNEAIEAQEALLREHPGCLWLREEFLGSLARTRDRARTRAVLASIVERGILPGIHAQQDWRHPPATYVARYADFLTGTAEDLRHAERLLWKAIRTEPYNALACHVLGDVRVYRGDGAGSVVPFRAAACLEIEDDHYARSASDALRRCGREDEGLTFLAERAGRLGGLPQGGPAWCAWIDALEDYGRPDEAIEVALRAERERSDDAILHAYTARFWVRMGRWDDAERALRKVGEGERRAPYLEAAVAFLRIAGRWEEAVPLCEEWLAECPDSLPARRARLWLIAREQGPAAALRLAERWMQERSGDEEIQSLYYEEVERAGLLDEAIALLRSQLARNPRDGWTWREMANRLLDRAEREDGPARDATFAEVDEVLSQCERICPGDGATSILRGRSGRARGAMGEALAHFLQSLQIDPESPYAYGAAWESATDLAPDEARALFERLEGHLLRTIGLLHGARRLAMMAAHRFGVREAERAVERWRARAPDDPEVIEAQVDLLLEHGEGTSDAARAAEILEPAVRRFPNHADLRTSLAHAYHILLREEDEIAVLREIVRRNPLDGFARRTLAGTLARRGAFDDARISLEEGIRCDPLDIDSWLALAQLLIDRDRRDEALEILRRGLARRPESVPLRRRLAEVLLEGGRGETALETAQKGVEIRSDDAEARLLLADILRLSGSHADLARVEEAYRAALACDAGLWDAADPLAVLLSSRGRFEEARRIMDAQIPRLHDKSPAYARLAWILRQEGKRAEAVDRMAEVTRRWPHHTWAWWRLMEWLEEDEAWDRVRQIFAAVPPEVLDEPVFGARRLMLLGRAGVAAETLDPEWDRLLENFPQDEGCFTRRFDVLAERGDWDGAGRAIEAIERFHPRSPFVLARKVQWLAHAARDDDAIVAAVALWQLPGEDEAWPINASWEAIEGRGLARRAADAALRRLEDGERLRPQALYRALGHDAGASRRGGTRRRVRRMLGLLHRLDGVQWDSSPCKAVVLSRLLDLRARAAALRYWCANRETCRRQTPVWQEIGRILRACGRRRWMDLRAWMADWREHPGVEMWAVAVYSSSLRARPRDILWTGPREDLEELHATSRDALDRLAHDHTARYHACTLCETFLRFGRDQEFAAAYERYRGLIEDASADHWMPPESEAAARVLPRFHRLLGAEDPRDVVRLTRGLRSLAPFPSWVIREWIRRARPKVDLIRGVVIRILIGLCSRG
ncbi:MAG: tetratricopeptide repeat protein [Planctomycetes bacterium]|nr:tetratricopeptide repeat protein [Planctomycetota bacterium]